MRTAGLIPEPFLGRNETEVARAGRREWTYEVGLPGVDAADGHEETDRTPSPRLYWYPGIHSARLLGAARDTGASWLVTQFPAPLR